MYLYVNVCRLVLYMYIYKKALSINKLPVDSLPADSWFYIRFKKKKCMHDSRSNRNYEYK